jgi:hypothetical protein
MNSRAALLKNMKRSLSSPYRGEKKEGTGGGEWG